MALCDSYALINIGNILMLPEEALSCVGNGKTVGLVVSLLSHSRSEDDRLTGKVNYHDSFVSSNTSGGSNGVRAVEVRACRLCSCTE